MQEGQLLRTCIILFYQECWLYMVCPAVSLLGYIRDTGKGTMLKKVTCLKVSEQDAKVGEEVGKATYFAATCHRSKAKDHV